MAWWDDVSRDGESDEDDPYYAQLDAWRGPDPYDVALRELDTHRDEPEAVVA